VVLRAFHAEGRKGQQVSVGGLTSYVLSYVFIITYSVEISSIEKKSGPKVAQLSDILLNIPRYASP
jgi:hypothetical protein